MKQENLEKLGINCPNCLAFLKEYLQNYLNDDKPPQPHFYPRQGRPTSWSQIVERSTATFENLKFLVTTPYCKETRGEMFERVFGTTTLTGYITEYTGRCTICNSVWEYYGDNNASIECYLYQRIDRS